LHITDACVDKLMCKITEKARIPLKTLQRTKVQDRKLLKELGIHKGSIV